MNQTTSSAPATGSFLQRRPIRRWLRRLLTKWRERHRHPFNFGIHIIGIPIAVAGILLLCFGSWWWGLGMFVGGYLLQYVGHLVEGNDLGEWAAIKRLLGLPCVTIAPRWEQTKN